MGAARNGGAESGAWSTRNAVETEPARNAGCRTSQRRNGRFVTTPSISVASRALASRAIASCAVDPVGDELRDHRVVREADLVSLLDAGVDANAGRQHEAFEPPRLGQEVPGILCVQARLDRVPAGRDVQLDLLACGDAELQLDDVEPGDLLGDRMLDLDPAVELEEEDVVAGDEELGRACAFVADRLGERPSPRTRSVTTYRGSSSWGGDSSISF